MVEREIRREKVLESRAREIRLKQKSDKAAQVDEGEEGAPSAAAVAAADEAAAEQAKTFIDKYVTDVEKEFTKKLREEIKRSKSRKMSQAQDDDLKDIKLPTKKKRKPTGTEDDMGEPSGEGGEGGTGGEDEEGQEGEEDEEEEVEEEEEESGEEKVDEEAAA